MFIEVDVVEFTDREIPYTTVLVNLNAIAHVQPIGKRHRELYAIGRNNAIEKQLIDPNVMVSPIEHLPNSGAVLHVMGGHLAPTYYTVTPFSEIKDAILKFQKGKEVIVVLVRWYSRRGSNSRFHVESVAIYH